MRTHTIVLSLVSLLAILACSGPAPKKASKPKKPHDPVAELMRNNPDVEEFYPDVAKAFNKEGNYMIEVNGQYIQTIDMAKSIGDNHRSCDFNAPNTSVDIHLDAEGTHVVCSYKDPKGYPSRSLSYGWKVSPDSKLVLVFDGDDWQRL